VENKKAVKSDPGGRTLFGRATPCGVGIRLNGSFASASTPSNGKNPTAIQKSLSSTKKGGGANHPPNGQLHQRETLWARSFSPPQGGSQENRQRTLDKVIRAGKNPSTRSRLASGRDRTYRFRCGADGPIPGSICFSTDDFRINFRTNPRISV